LSISRRITFLNSGYPMTSATGSAAPIGDMMIIIGDAIFGQGNGRTFMLIEAFTVFLAIIGTTLSCMNTGARVTYAMGKDSELPDHFGALHNSQPDAAPRYLDVGGIISAVVGVVGVSVPFGDAGALWPIRPLRRFRTASGLPLAT
jgi:APA family basic amino acid/polyamine antiporter